MRPARAPPNLPMGVRTAPATTTSRMEMAKAHKGKGLSGRVRMVSREAGSPPGPPCLAPAKGHGGAALRCGPARDRSGTRRRATGSGTPPREPRRRGRAPRPPTTARRRTARPGPGVAPTSVEPSPGKSQLSVTRDSLFPTRKVPPTRRIGASRKSHWRSVPREVPVRVVVVLLVPRGGEAEPEGQGAVARAEAGRAEQDGPGLARVRSGGVEAPDRERRLLPEPPPHRGRGVEDLLVEAQAGDDRHASRDAQVVGEPIGKARKDHVVVGEIAVSLAERPSGGSEHQPGVVAGPRNRRAPMVPR